MINPSDVDWFAMTLSSALGLIGRLMFLSQENRRPFSWSLLWELPIAIGMGIIGHGIGQWVGLFGLTLFSASIVCGYLGPRVISWIIAHYIKIPVK